MKNLDRMLLGLGVLIPFWLFFGVLLTALAYPDYSHLDQAMSQLGAQGSPTQGFSAWVNNLPLGVLFVLFAVGVLRRLRGSRLALFSAGLMLVHGLASFATGQIRGDGNQASHWKDNQSLGIMDPTTAPGEQLTITALDLTAFDVIGWNLTSTPTVSAPSAPTVATPAPASALVFAFGLAGLGCARRRTLA
jgi:hypothetical protein